MKGQLLVLAVLLALLICDSLAEKPRKFKKFRKAKTTSSTTEEVPDSKEVEQDEFQLMAKDEEAEELRKKEEKKELEGKAVEDELVQNSEEKVRSNEVPLHDQCLKKHCGAGRVCEVSEEGKAECVCIPSCSPESDPRRKVCSNHNETWGSDCEVYQMRCWCDHGNAKCPGEDHKHLHIDYYGECRQLPECTQGEMADFPRRMRDWLFNIMQDMADRQELTPHYLKMEREAEMNQTRRWTNSAIWKWCDLDGHPHDRSVSRHELFPIRAPLVALEHCISPFLDSCDQDDDHRITLREWGQCLQLPEEDLNERCDELLGD